MSLGVMKTGNSVSGKKKKHFAIKEISGIICKKKTIQDNHFGK